MTLSSGVVQSDGEHRLNGHAQPAAVDIKPVSQGRRLITLPELEFPLSIDADCYGEARAESLSISIADTVETHDISMLDTDLTSRIEIETLFRIPRGQIAPIAIDRFCTSDDDHSLAARTLLVPLAAANISLRCSNENSQSIRYASAALEIRLTCIPLDDPADRPQDQGTSAPTRRL